MSLVLVEQTDNRHHYALCTAFVILSEALTLIADGQDDYMAGGSCHGLWLDMKTIVTTQIERTRELLRN